MARPADAVADGLAADEVGGLERPELLEDAGPARAEALGELVGRARAVEAEAQRGGRGGASMGPPGRVGRPGGDVAVAADGLRTGRSGSGIPDRLAPVVRGAAVPVVRSGRWTSTSPRSTSLLRDTIRDFMLTEVAPVIDEHERERRFPIEIVRRIGELGWLGIPIPEDEGGAGLDTLAYAIAIEEIGRVWGSLGLIVAAHTSLGCGPLHLAGTARAEAALPRADGARRGHRRRTA